MSNAATKQTPAVIIRRVVKAKRDRVFQAWTDPDKMKDWFYCGEGRANVANELKVGGAYSNEMIMESGTPAQCGAESPKNIHLHYGEYLEVTPPEKIVFTWNSEIVKDSRVTVELRDLGSDTEVLITHELLNTEELRKQHTMGWDGCLINLEKYFA